MQHELTCVISGGQTGADIAGVRTAKFMGIPTGGWMPKGWRTEAGPKPEYAAMYGMREHRDPSYLHRTWENVQDSHGTIIIASDWSGGTRQTIGFCERAGRPHFKVHIQSMDHMAFMADESPMHFVDWLITNNVRCLNVAGNRESKSPGIDGWVAGYLTMACWALRRQGDVPML